MSEPTAQPPKAGDVLVTPQEASDIRALALAMRRGWVPTVQPTAQAPAGEASSVVKPKRRWRLTLPVFAIGTVLVLLLVVAIEGIAFVVLSARAIHDTMTLPIHEETKQEVQKPTKPAAPAHKSGHPGKGK